MDRGVEQAVIADFPAAFLSYLSLWYLSNRVGDTRQGGEQQA